MMLTAPRDATWRRHLTSLPVPLTSPSVLLTSLPVPVTSLPVPVTLSPTSLPVPVTSSPTSFPVLLTSSPTSLPVTSSPTSLPVTSSPTSLPVAVTSSPTSLPVLLQSAFLLLLLLLSDVGSGFVSGYNSDSAASTHHPQQGQAVQCNVAQQNCAARIGCSMALHNYMMKCGQVMLGQAEGCSPGCRKALVSLLSTEDRQGEAFMECNCNDNDYCHTQKRRLEVCSRDVLDAMKRLNDDSIQISCSLAELICRADTSCLTALSFFDRNCAKLQTGEKCTARCNNSLDILLRQRKARKLSSCICDGTETYQCQTVQGSIDRLCHYRTRHHHDNHTRPTRPAPHHHTTPPPAGVKGNHQGAPPSSCTNASSDVSSQCQPITSSAVTSFLTSPTRTMWYCDVIRTLQLAWLLLFHFLLRCR